MSKFFDKISVEWKELIPYLDALEKTDQSPTHHAEGNCLNHTKMVLDEFEKLLPTLSLTDKEIEIVNYALLLHDIAKPATYSVDDNGEIHAYGHTNLGGKIAWEILESTDLDFETRKEISILVKYHGKPVWIIREKTHKQERSVVSLSMDCKLYLLYVVAMCDNLGRITANKDKNVEAVEYFKLLADEIGCLYEPYQFLSDIAKVKYLIEKTHYRTDLPFDDTKSHVKILCGFPGAGKDTYISSLDDAIVVSLDDIRKELKVKPTDPQGKVTQVARNVSKKLLAAKKDFVWNATNITKQLREIVINLCLDYNAYVEIVYIATPYKRCLKQNNNRDESKIVPLQAMEKMKRKFDFPLNIEAHKVTYIS